MSELFDQIGIALHGKDYKTQLAIDLNINRKTVQRILKGEQSVNPNLYIELDKQITERIALLEKLQKDINDALSQ